VWLKLPDPQLLLGPVVRDPEGSSDPERELLSMRVEALESEAEGKLGRNFILFSPQTFLPIS